jgi:hypothetical protein
VKLTRTREHVINMGNYESLRIGATIEVDTDTIARGAEEEPIHAASQFAEAQLSKALEKDINDAVDLLPGGSDSYILSWGNNA